MKEQKIPFYFMGEPYVIIPLKLIEDKKSKGSDLLVYLAISSFLHGRQWAAASQKEIMRRAKYFTPRTIMRTITHLEKIGWITKHRRGLTQTNIIILHAKKNQKLSLERKMKIKDEVEENGG